MELSAAQLILDKHPLLKGLPINGSRTGTSYTSGYETPSGRHIVLDRRGNKSGPRLFVENSFDASSMALSTGCEIMRYGPTRPRVDLRRASERLAGPKNATAGADSLCFKSFTESDLNAVLDCYLKT